MLAGGTGGAWQLGVTIGASAFRDEPAQDPQPEPKPKEVLDLSQPPPQLFLAVLSHVPKPPARPHTHTPPRTLLGCCCQRRRSWHALVDSQALWLLILA